MAQTDLENASTGQWVSTEQSAANTAETITIPAGGAGTRVRLFRVTVSSDIANTAGTLTLKPDNSASPWVVDLDQKIGIVGDFPFAPPIYGKDNTAFAVTVSAFGGAGNAAKSRISCYWDYQR